MNSTIISRLNQINVNFYAQVAGEFASTREQPWEGWRELPELLKSASENDLKICRNEGEELRVLDLGCGNGRWGEFLQKEFPSQKIFYHGVDNSSELLTVAQKKLSILPNSLHCEFSQIDLVESVLSDTFRDHFNWGKYHIITLFGVLHHIPRFALREKLLQQASELLADGGLLIYTAWQLPHAPQLLKRQVAPTQLDLTEKDLEPNDYFLTWERGASAIRYVHFIDEAEQKKLTENLQKNAQLTLLKIFTADGKDQQANKYFVFQKNS